MTNRNRFKIRSNPPPLNIDEFNKLTDILFETLRENHAACARVLGINVRTWRKWEKEQPTWPYWNMVLRKVLIAIIPQIEGNRGFGKKHRQRLLNAIRELPKNDPILEELEEKSYNVAASVSYLRLKLIKRGMFTDELFTTANMGGFSERALRNAAATLGVVKTQEGYGKHKRSYWRLPNEDDE